MRHNIVPKFLLELSRLLEIDIIEFPGHLL